MAQRQHHYERAFEAYLRLQRIPYVAVDEARKALLPEDAPLEITLAAGAVGPHQALALKSFDFVLYAPTRNLLVDVKGRKVARRAHSGNGLATGRLESWVTQDDIDSLRHWRDLFGTGFDAAFVFVYWCDEQPPDGLFQEVFDFQARWYALRAITLDAYVSGMKPRSARWRTVHLPTAQFERLSQPFCPPWVGSGGEARSAKPVVAALD